MGTTAIGVLTAIAIGAAPAWAPAKTVAGRQRHEENRIERGAESGRLTPRETERLENQQQTIRDERQRAAEDGKISRGERHEIRHDEKAASRSIHHKAHNDRGRH